MTGNSVAVAEFQYQYYDAPDLTAFASKCKTPAITVATTIGGNSPSESPSPSHHLPQNQRRLYCPMSHIGACGLGLDLCLEALLDIEYLGAITAPIPMTDIYSSTCEHNHLRSYITNLEHIICHPYHFYRLSAGVDEHHFGPEQTSPGALIVLRQRRAAADLLCIHDCGEPAVPAGGRPRPVHPRRIW